MPNCEKNAEGIILILAPLNAKNCQKNKKKRTSKKTGLNLYNHVIFRNPVSGFLKKKMKSFVENVYETKRQLNVNSNNRNNENETKRLFLYFFFFFFVVS